MNQNSSSSSGSNNGGNRHQGLSVGGHHLHHPISCGPSALIHHPPSQPMPPSSSASSSYPSSPSYPSLGISNGSVQHQQYSPMGSGGIRGNSASIYSAKVLAFQQGGANRAAPQTPSLPQSSNAAFGLPAGNNSSHSSRPSSVEDSVVATAAIEDDDDDSFFNFDSLTSHQPSSFQQQHLTFPPPGPLHPSELQLAGKHHLITPPSKKKKKKKSSILPDRRKPQNNFVFFIIPCYMHIHFLNAVLINSITIRPRTVECAS